MFPQYVICIFGAFFVHVWCHFGTFGSHLTHLCAHLAHFVQFCLFSVHFWHFFPFFAHFLLPFTHFFFSFTHVALDIITESACGFNADALHDATVPYVDAVKVACEEFIRHTMRMPFLPPFIWHLLPSGRRFLGATEMCRSVCQRFLDDRRAARARGYDLIWFLI